MQNHGTLWWLRHYLGAFLAEQVFFGPLSLDGGSSTISTTTELVRENIHQQLEPSADFVTVAVQHGAIWAFSGHGLQRCGLAVLSNRLSEGILCWCSKSATPTSAD